MLQNIIKKPLKTCTHSQGSRKLVIKSTAISEDTKGFEPNLSVRNLLFLDSNYSVTFLPLPWMFLTDAVHFSHTTANVSPILSDELTVGFLVVLKGIEPLPKQNVWCISTQYHVHTAPCFNTENKMYC